MRRDHRGRSVSAVAAAAHSSDGGLTWLFTLRPDLMTPDGEPLDAAAVVRFWRQHRAAGGLPAWIAEDIAAGPIATDMDTVQFTMHQPRPDLPILLSHPAAAFLPRAGMYHLTRRGSAGPDHLDLEPAGAREHQAGAALALAARPAGGVLDYLAAGRRRAALLLERDLVAPVPAGVRVECAPAAVRYFLHAAAGHEGTVLMLSSILDRERLVMRVAPSTGRPLAEPLVAGSSPDSGARHINLMVDADDSLAVALADQMQADLLDGPLQLRLQVEAGPRFEARLRAGAPAVALLGARRTFTDPLLDLEARLQVAGGRRQTWREALAAARQSSSSRDRLRLAAAIEANLGRAGKVVPILAVGECWGLGAGVSLRRDLAALTRTAVPAFAPWRRPRAPRP